jgi:hypothetical protein
MCLDGAPDRGLNWTVVVRESHRRHSCRRRAGLTGENHTSRAVDDHLLPERRPNDVVDLILPKVSQRHLQIGGNSGPLEAENTSDFR